MSRESAVAYVFLAFIASVGIFYVLALPAIVTALVDGLGFSDQQAGYVSSANAYGSMTGALIAVLLVRSCDWKKTVAAMFVVMIAMEIVTTKISSPGTMAAWRFVSGAVGGCSVGIGLAVLARLRHPDRAFGLLFLEQFGLGGFLILFRPLVIPYLGVTGIFVMLAILMLIGLLAIPFLDDYEVEETTDSNRSKLPPFTLYTVLCLAGIFLFQTATNGTWTYIERIGTAMQFTDTAVSGAVAVATWAGIGGALVPITLGKHFGRTVPIVAGILTTIAGVFAVYGSDALLGFTIGGATINFAWSFGLAYMFGITAHYDKTGQLTTLGGMASKFGLATGPLVATFFISGNDYGSLLVASAVGLLICLLASIAPARHADHGE